MHLRSRWIGPAVSLAAGIFASSAAAQDLTAYVGRSGEVTIRRTDSGKTVATVRPGLFEAGWQFRGVNANRAADAAPGINGVISVNQGKDRVSVTGSAEAEGRRLNLRYTLTPSAAVNVNSVHVSVNVPMATWVGAQWRHGEQSGTIPASAGPATVQGGQAREVTLQRGDARVVVSAPEPAPMLIQDNRIFNGSDLEVRVGPQEPGGAAWAAGAARTIAFSVDLGAPVTVEEEKPVVLTANENWIPLDLKLDIAPGSALDYSSLVEAPAGKYGRVVTRPDGHFAFERRNAPQRFYGVNLCFSANYLDKPDADRLAERLQRLGYNTVRIHHFEGELVDSSAPDSLTIRQDSLDKLDYLVAALKRRGMYVKTDLFISRPIRKDEAPGDNFKMALLVSPKAMANWKAFVAKLLNHQNPYTKLAWKDDPAVAWLSVVNEGHAINYLGGLDAELYGMFQTAWQDWLKTRYGTDAKVAAAWGEQNAGLTAALPRNADLSAAKGRDVAAFVAQLHGRAYDEMSGFLRRDIGTKALLTDLNGWSEIPQNAVLRTRMDWVDNHFYWDHPHFLEQNWSLPSEGGHGGRSALDSPGGGPHGVAMTRLFGKPFSVSEFNYSAPNPYRAEGGLMMGAVSALQDWDAVWRFAYSHNRNTVREPGAMNYFDVVTDPAGQASDRAAVMLFLRGDLKPASGVASLVRRSDELMQPTGPIRTTNLSDLTQVTRIGVRVEEPGKPLPAAGKAEVRIDGPASADPAASDAARVLTALKASKEMPSANQTDLAKGVRESETGELMVDVNESLLRIDTPRTAGGAAPSGQTLTAGPLKAAVSGTRAVVWASSLDGKPLRQSARIMLAHVTDVQNTNMRYAGPDRRILEAWGGLPHLVRVGQAQVTLQHAQAARLQAWRLDTSGNRVAPLPVRVENGQAVIDLTTRGADGKATLYYEVAVGK